MELCRRRGAVGLVQVRTEDLSVQSWKEGLAGHFPEQVTFQDRSLSRTGLVTSAYPAVLCLSLWRALMSDP